MAISDKAKRLASDRYENYINKRTEGLTPAVAVPEFLDRFQPGLTQEDKQFFIGLVEGGRANATAINRQRAGTPPVVINTPENPFIVPDERPDGSRWFTTDVEFTDTRTGERGKWAVSFSSPIDMTLNDIQDMAADIFFDRYNRSPQFGDGTPGPGDIETKAVVDLVVLG